jgi:hypothetical protein
MPYNKLFIVLCVPRFTLPGNVVLKCFEGLHLSKMDMFFLKTKLDHLHGSNEYISFRFVLFYLVFMATVLFVFSLFGFHSNCFVYVDWICGDWTKK